MTALQFVLRPSAVSDEPFLNLLFESTRGQQFALLPLAPAQRAALIQMQFNAQCSGYRRQYPDSRDFIILLDEKPAGRLWLNETGTEILVVDVAVLPERQGRGLGTAVLQQIIQTAARLGKTVRLRVDRMNFRGARLYRRLGFQVTSGDEVSEEMELPPG